jgi:outer membrane lipoprotein-sorting protein
MRAGRLCYDACLGENRLNTRATGVSLKPIRITLLSILSLLLFSASVSAQNGAKPNLEYVLSMMDRSAADFKSLTAAIEHIKYTAVVKDTSSESGEIFVRKDSKMRIDFQSPDPRTIIRNGDNLYIYTPKINRVEEYNIGKNRVTADQYLALGFGTRMEALRKNYSVTLAGEEELDGRKTAIIELVPRNDEVQRQISKIDMWVDESSWLPIQQKFFEASGQGDYFMSRYTKVMKNLKLGDGKFKPDWPKGTRIEKPRG